MAATLTDAGELMKADVFVSFGIDKVESTPDGDLLCYGRATDGSVDHDQQIVDPTFSSKSIRGWLESGGNVRVQHNAQRDPAGVGLEVNTDADGATWVKSLIVEPVAKKLLAAGALRAYSVGIARPTIVRDAVAKGGRITAGEIVEISLVDRPANARCGVQLVKSAGDGTPEYTGMVFGSDDDIAKALDGGVVEKAADTWTAAAQAPAPGSIDVPSVPVPGDLNVTITPNDIMRVMQAKFVSQHYDELAVKAVAEAEDTLLGKDHREFSADERRQQASAGNALPDGSYPVPDKDALGRAAVLARSGHGDVAAARRLIARRARELGVQNPLDESDAVKKTEPYTGPVEPVQEALEKVAAEHPDSVIVLPPAVKEAEPEVTKDPPAEPKPKPVKKAKKKPKKLPPWLNKPKDGGDDGDDKDSDDDDSSCKSAHAWEITDPESGSVECSKCHTSPAAAAGVTASQMDPAPVGELQESQAPSSVKGATPASASGATAVQMDPVPAHREPDGATTETFEKDAGLPSDGEAANNLEAAAGVKTVSADLAADPELAALMRFKHLGVDDDMGRLHDLTCPAFHPEMTAKYHPYSDLPGLIESGAWQKRAMLAVAGPLEQALKTQELWAAVGALKSADQAALNDWRLELHKAFRDANPGPGTFPTPGSVSPQRYNRPVLPAGRAANAADYDGPRAAPLVASGAPNAQSFDRPPLSSAQASPSPSFMKGGFEYPAEQGVPQRISYETMERDKARRALSMLHDHLNHMFPSACPMLDQDAYRQPEARPVPAGVGKAIDPEPAPAAAASSSAAFKAEPETGGDRFADASVYKGYKKMRKKLGKKVLAGKITVDEARAKMGRQFAQKGTEPSAEPVQKSHSERVVAEQPAFGEYLRDVTVTAYDPEVIKAAVIEATAPLLERLEKQQGDFTTKLAEQQKVIDAIADQPDPSTASFSGLAFQPQTIKSRRPAAVPDQAEYAARAQAMIRRNLQNTYETHSDPHVREAANSALAGLGVGAEVPPMT